MNDQVYPSEAVFSDPIVRRAITQRSHQLFFSIYLGHYMTYPMAEFQKSIFRLTEDATNKLGIVVAFRGSAKSTIMTFSNVLWSILGKPKKKFILILCQTQVQARQHMMNIKKELEDNALLKSDLGPFQEDSGDEWGLASLTFKNTKARIMVASIEQSVRGIRHREHRPDLILMDDIEDLNSTRTMEGRNKTFDWFTREIVPLGDVKTRILIVGNLLHQDALVMRLKKKIEQGEMSGTFLWFPLIDKNGNCLWSEKFDTPSKIEDLRRKIGNDLAWKQEYLLQVVSDEMKLVPLEWIQYYDDLPDGNQFRLAASGADLAISERENADYTAIVSAGVYGYDQEFGIYVFPNPVNERLSFPKTLERIRALDDIMREKGEYRLYIEDAGYQRALIQQLIGYQVVARGVSPNGADKRSRIAFITELIRLGIVRFPRKGCEALINQLVGFGEERHDDLADAFSLVIGQLQRVSRNSYINDTEDRGECTTITGNLMKRRF